MEAESKEYLSVSYYEEKWLSAKRIDSSRHLLVQSQQWKQQNYVLNQKPESLIVHVGTNNLTNEINLPNNIKEIVTKTKQKSPNTEISFSNIIIRKDKKNLEKLRADTNSRLKNYCSQKNLRLINHDNIKENHLGVKKLHLNRKGNSVFAKNLFNFIEGS